MLLPLQGELYLCNLRDPSSPGGSVKRSLRGSVSGASGCGLWKVQPRGDTMEYEPQLVEITGGVLGPVPGGRTGASHTMSGDTLYAFGGESLEGYGVFNDLWSLDLRTRKWSRLHEGGPWHMNGAPSEALCLLFLGFRVGNPTFHSQGTGSCSFAQGVRPVTQHLGHNDVRDFVF